nr:Rgg/GadR/MutR family transcriptional regulator [Enterococcus cecorum]
MEEYGKILKRIRLEKGLTQKELSVGILSRSHLSELENGNYYCSFDKFLQLLRRLNVSLHEFDLYLKESIYQEDFRRKIKIEAAVNAHDIAEMKRLLAEFPIVDEKNVRMRHEKLLLEALIEYHQNHQIMNLTRYQEILDYLSRVSEWGMYELNLLANFLFIFDMDTLPLIMQQIYKKANKKNASDEYTYLYLRLLINLSDFYLKNLDYQTCQEIAQQAIAIAYQKNNLFELTLAKIHFYLADILKTQQIHPNLPLYCQYLESIGLVELSQMIQEDIHYYTNIAHSKKNN